LEKSDKLPKMGNVSMIGGQIEKEGIARDAMLDRYLALIQRMENYFRGFSVEHIERSKNTDVDELAKAAARQTTLPRCVFLDN
jgi:hypothetical protein